jgi:hypothetical protein
MPLSSPMRLKNAADTAAKIVFGDNVRDTARPDLTSESHAAGLYFMYNKNPEVDSEDGFISIDIGGGSTDISIWQHEQNRAKAEASVKFAGRDILTNAALELCDDDIYLRKLWMQMGVSDIVLKEVSRTIEGTDISKAMLFDTMLAYAKNQLISSLGIYNGQKPLSNVIKLVTFNLALLVALAGTMLRELLANDLFDLRKKLTVVFCGNGSKTRDWLKAEDKEALLARVLREAAGKDLADTNIKFVTINNPKEVVAAGLVSVKNLRRSDETFNAADYASDVLAQKVVIRGDGTKNESSKAEVLALFDKLYEILSSDDLSFKLNGYKSFRTKEDFMSKMNAAFSALDPVGSGYDRITYAYAFVRCAQVANTMLIADMKNDM